jgi:hypothetical protein
MQVRLKAGDPFVFGRSKSEIVALGEVQHQVCRPSYGECQMNVTACMCAANRVLFVSSLRRIKKLIECIRMIMCMNYHKELHKHHTHVRTYVHAYVQTIHMMPV